MRLQDTTYARGAESLSEAIRDLNDKGWAGDATPLEGGSVRCGICQVTSPGAGITVEGLHRLEGASDPDDMAAVLAITCPACNAKAVLVLAYGPMASAADADVLRALPDPPTAADTP